MSVNSPYMTLAELAEYVRLEKTKDPLTNASKWLKRNKVPTRGRGRVLVLRASVDEALADGAREREGWKRTRSEAVRPIQQTTKQVTD